MKKGAQLLSILFLCLLITSIALAQNQKSSTEVYVEELHNQGKERVIVTFKDEINLSLIDQYNGEVIRPLKIINGLICVIPRENIELLKKEDEVENLAIDGLVKTQPGSEKRDWKDFRRFLRCKRRYFKNIRREYRSARKVARRELKKALKVCRLNRSSRRSRRKGYRICLRQAIEEYRNKIAMARNGYGIAVGAWEEKVNEMVTMAYGGPVIVRWNNLEAGMNTQAAWDNYDLDGTGIKIAFIDTGVNYTMENLDDNYLGGYDYAADPNDDNPINPDDNEIHGTEVVSLAVGEGVNKVVGVAYNASYYAIRVFEGPNPSTGWISDAISAIEWASTEPHKADIISMSFGFYEPINPVAKLYLRDACNAAYNQGIVLVAGSGNEGDSSSGYPAAFGNVISVGSHAEDQSIDPTSNGGVDIVAPGARVYAVHPDNSTWWVWGTSFATPHASALIALQLQYARLQNIETNNGYNWEVMKHSAIDLGLDPTYQGKGKIWAAEIASPPLTPELGSVDLMSSSMWPFDDYGFTYFNYLYLDQGLYPAYFVGTSMYQDITLTNATNTLGNTPETIEGLNVTTTQKYRDTGEILPGDSIEDFKTYEPIAIGAGLDAILQDTYYIPWSAPPGLYNVVLDLEFTLAGDTRVLKITDNEASIWCPPPAINEGFPIAE